MSTRITDSLYNDNIHTVSTHQSIKSSKQQHNNDPLITLPTSFTSKQSINISLQSYNTSTVQLYNDTNKLQSIIYKSCSKPSFALDKLNSTTNKELLLSPYTAQTLTVQHTPQSTEYGKRMECCIVIQWLKYTVRLNVDRNVPLKGSKQASRRNSTIDADNKENQSNNSNKRTSNHKSNINNTYNIDLSTIKSKINSFPQSKPSLSRLPSREQRIAQNNGAWSTRRNSIQSDTHDTMKPHSTDKSLQLWALKQEIGFTKWLNHILLHGTTTDTNTDNGLSELLHTKSMSHIYDTACQLIHCIDSNGCMSKILHDVMNDKLSLKSDILVVHTIDSLKKSITNTITKSITHEYCRFAVECITEHQYDINTVTYEKLIELYLFDSNQLQSIASARLQSKLLFSPNKPVSLSNKKLHLYSDSQKTELYRTVLYKLIELTLVLDQLKHNELLPHKPLLFCHTNQPTDITSTQQLLPVIIAQLCNETTLYQRLTRYGYTLQYQQKSIDTIDMCITCLAVDLRDGVRLCKIVDLLQLDTTSNLVDQLYLPSNTYEKKMHNINLALNTLQQYYTSMPLIRADDIVQGNQSKTLALVGYLIMNYDINTVLDSTQLLNEINRITKYRTNSIRQYNTSIMYTSEKLQLLLQWIQLICTISTTEPCTQHTAIKVNNFNNSLIDGVALCLLINYYYPTLIRRSDIMYCHHSPPSDNNQPSRDASESIDIRSYRLETNFATITHVEPSYAERCGQHNYDLFNSAIQQLGHIPVMLKYDTQQDEKLMIIFMIYLCQRLLVLSNEIHAVTTIQRLYRRKYNKQIQHNSHHDDIDISTQIHDTNTQLNTSVLSSVLPALNTSLHNITDLSNDILMDDSVHSIHDTSHISTNQSSADVTSQLLHAHQQRQCNAAIILQSYTRRHQAQRKLQQMKTIQLIEYKRRQHIIHSAIKIQSIVRRKLAQNQYHQLKSLIQQKQLKYMEDERQRIEIERVVYEQRMELQRIELQRIESERIERIRVADEIARIDAQIAADQEQQRIANELEQQRFYNEQQVELARIAAEQAELERIQLEQLRLDEEHAKQQDRINEKLRLDEMNRLQCELEHTAATCIQSHIRTYLAHHRYSQILHSAIILQSAWRGKQLRSQSTNKIVHIRDKLKNVTNKLDQHMKIGQRTKSAVELLLSSKSLTIVNQACVTLEVVTKLLPVCCHDAVEQGTVSILYDLLQTCNHSQPHLVLIDIVLKILINLVNNKSTRNAVLQHTNSINILMKQFTYIKSNETILMNVLLLLNMSVQYYTATTIQSIQLYWESQAERKLNGIELQLQRELDKCTKRMKACTNNVANKHDVQCNDKLILCIQLINKLRSVVL